MLSSSYAALVAAAGLAKLAVTGGIGPTPPVQNYSVPVLKPTVNWDGTRSGSANSMASLTPPVAYSYQEMAGYTGPKFNEEAIAAFDEYPGVFVEDSKHRIVVGSVNCDPQRGGIAKVVFRFGDSFVESTQQIYTSRKTCGFPVDISSFDKDGDALLTADVYPVRGYPTRIDLPLTLATNGTLKRQIVYVNPDTTSHTVVRQDDNSTIVIPPGDDATKTLALRTGNFAPLGDYTQPFKTWQKAVEAFIGAVNGGSCDILVVPNTTLLCDNPPGADIYATLKPNNNTRMIRVRPVSATGMMKWGRNDKSGYYADPANPYVYAAPSSQYGGVSTGPNNPNTATGQPVYNADGSQYEPTCFSGSIMIGAYCLQIQQFHVDRADIDLSTFRFMGQRLISGLSNGASDLTGKWNYGNAFACFSNCNIHDAGSNGGPTGQSGEVTIAGYDNKIIISGAMSLSLVESTYLAPALWGPQFMRNVDYTCAYDLVKSVAFAQPDIYWNVVGIQDQEAIARTCLPAQGVTVNNVTFREDGWQFYGNNVLVSGISGTTATYDFQDAAGNPTPHGLSVGSVFSVNVSGPNFYNASAKTIVSPTRVTASIGNSLAAGVHAVGINKLTQSPNQYTVGNDGVTVYCLDADQQPAIRQLEVGNIFALTIPGGFFKTTVIATPDIQTMVLADTWTGAKNSFLYGYSGFSVISITPPSSLAGGMNHLYYSKTSRGLAQFGNLAFMSDISTASGCKAFILTGKAIGLTNGLSSVLNQQQTLDVPSAQVGVIPSQIITPTSSYTMPTLRTVGTALALSFIPQVLVNSGYNGASLFKGQQIVRDDTGESRWVVDTQTTALAVSDISLTPNTANPSLQIATATVPDSAELRVGAYIAIAGASVAGFNGQVVIATIPDATSFTYTVPVALAKPAGTITASYIIHATLNAKFTNDAPAGTAYATACYTVMQGNMTQTLVPGDRFWAGAIAHSDYLQMVPTNAPLSTLGTFSATSGLTNSTKNWWFSNYTVNGLSVQYAIPESHRFTGQGTITTDGQGNGFVTAPTSPLTISSTTTGGVGGTTVCTTYDSTGKAAPHGLQVGQKIAILNSNGTVFAVGVMKSTNVVSNVAISSQFVLVTPLASDVVKAGFKTGVLFWPGDQLIVLARPILKNSGGSQTNTQVDTGRRVKALSVDANFNQTFTLSEDFPATIYPNGVSNIAFSSDKNPWNLGIVNSTFALRGIGAIGAGLSGPLSHWAYVQTTGWQPLYAGSGYPLRDGITPQDFGWFDAIAGTIAGDLNILQVIPAKDCQRDNVSCISFNAANNDPADAAFVCAFTYSTDLMRPTSTNHKKIVGQLYNGTPTGRALVPYDAEGNLLVPGVSFVGGLQPIAP